MCWGFLIVPGMILIVNNLQTDMLLGFWVGLVAAFLASLFSVLNKKFIEQADPYTITFLELGSAWLFISLILPFYVLSQGWSRFMPKPMDWWYLLVLALVCTTLAYNLNLRALKHLSAFASNLTFNLEPVYGIVLAWVILQENKELTSSFYWGAALILISVFSYPFLRKRFG
ncbi:MAG: DMT family transporter [Saprospiraceae bacterium]|nr:DMT family transporter [Saprospiraceae bacterium]